MSNTLKTSFMTGALLCLTVGCANTNDQAKLLSEKSPLPHDLVPFLNTWAGGGTATLDGADQTLEVYTQLKGLFSDGELNNETQVSTDFNLQGQEPKKFNYTIAFYDQHKFNIVVSGQTVGSGSCRPESTYDVTCIFTVPPVGHSEAFHFQRLVNQEEGYSWDSIKAEGTTGLWGRPADLKYELTSIL